MSQFFVKINSENFYVGADSRECVTFGIANSDVQAYWLSDSAQKLFIVGNKYIFISGIKAIGMEIIDNFKTIKEQTIEQLRDIIYSVTKKYINLAPYLLIENPCGLIDISVVNTETIDGEKRNIFYNISDNDYFQIKRYIAYKENYIPIATGLNTKEAVDMANSLMNELETKELYKTLFEYFADEKVGGTLHLIGVNKENGEFLNEKIKIDDKKELKKYKDYKHLFSHCILGERVVIGDTTGVFTIEGSKLTIQDRCKREVVKLGLLEENPDKFGLRFNHYASTDCGNTSVINHVGIDSDSGFFIDQKDGTTYKKTLWTSLDGLLNAQNLRISDSIIADGSMTIGKGNYVFKVDSEGLRLGDENFNSAPFHVSPDGIMYAKGGTFQDGQLIIGSGNTITVIDRLGFRIGNSDVNLAPAAIYPDGRARFKNLQLTDPNGRFLLDTATRDLDMDGWNILGAGRVDAQLIAANMVTSDMGYISALVAGRLSTLTNAALSDWSNYIRIEGNTAKWITGKVKGAGKQKTLDDGKPLYWKNSTQSGQMTTDETEWPVLEYEMDEKAKMEAGFEGSGDSSTPFWRMGIGDGGSGGSGIGWIKKPNGSFDFIYNASNTAKERSLKLTDEGILLKSDSGKFNVLGKDVNIIGDQGDIKISNGKASIVLSADGKITFNGTRFDFNTP